MHACIAGLFLAVPSWGGGWAHSWVGWTPREEKRIILPQAHSVTRLTTPPLLNARLLRARRGAGTGAQNERPRPGKEAHRPAGPAAREMSGR